MLLYHGTGNVQGVLETDLNPYPEARSYDDDHALATVGGVYMTDDIYGATRFALGASDELCGRPGIAVVDVPEDRLLCDEDRLHNILDRRLEEFGLRDEFGCYMGNAPRQFLTGLTRGDDPDIEVLLADVAEKFGPTDGDDGVGRVRDWAYWYVLQKSDIDPPNGIDDLTRYRRATDLVAATFPETATAAWQHRFGYETHAVRILEPIPFDGNEMRIEGLFEIDQINQGLTWNGIIPHKGQPYEDVEADIKEAWQWHLREMGVEPEKPEPSAGALRPA